MTERVPLRQRAEFGEFARIELPRGSAVAVSQPNAQGERAFEFWRSGKRTVGFVLGRNSIGALQGLLSVRQYHETDETVLDFEGQLRGKLAERFTLEARERGLIPAELAANILQAVIEDQLFTAVLDA